MIGYCEKSRSMKSDDGRLFASEDAEGLWF